MQHSMFLLIKSKNSKFGIHSKMLLETHLTKTKGGNVDLI